jgi:hypothetical protein
MPTNANQGDKMQNLKTFAEDVQLRLEGIGGEPLAGSGFETEFPEPEFAADLSEEK